MMLGNACHMTSLMQSVEEVMVKLKKAAASSTWLQLKTVPL